MNFSMQTFLAPIIGLTKPHAAHNSLYTLWQALFRTYSQVFKEYSVTDILLVPASQASPSYKVCEASYIPTGLSIKYEPTEDEVGWYIVYDREDKALAGPYDFIEEARLMASLLSCFDWNRPAYQFTRRELGDLNRMISLYRADTRWFKDLIMETWREYISPRSGDGEKNSGAQLSLKPVRPSEPIAPIPAGNLPEGSQNV